MPLAQCANVMINSVNIVKYFIQDKMSDIPHMSYLAIYILSVHMLHGSSKSSTLWKLNLEQGIIEGTNNLSNNVPVPGINSKEKSLEDKIFEIITSTVHHGKSWTKQSSEEYSTDCQSPKFNKRWSYDAASMANNKTGDRTPEDDTDAEPYDSVGYLDCGKPVNFTYYDNLVGIANRHGHPLVPEPQAAIFFKKKGSKTSDIDINVLEKKLKKAKREKPKSVQLYNQLGNFWRIKGDVQKAIECFRRALAVSPHNAEVLLNLARVLFNLQYLDDAIYLTRRSLEVQPPDKSAWQQYFTLGQIFKAYGHYQEAALHFRHTLELKPDCDQAMEALKDMDAIPDTTIHIYTMLIIICLVLGVLLIILSSMDSAMESDLCEAKTQRHFNRAMAMRSLKLGISPRALRPRRGANSGGVSTMCG